MKYAGDLHCAREICGSCRAVLDAALDTTERQLAELREAVGKAPHARNCTGMPWRAVWGTPFQNCDCWKSRALSARPVGE